jgi:hypothetical protein
VVVHFDWNYRSFFNSDRQRHCRRQHADLLAIPGFVAVLSDHCTVGPMMRTGPTATLDDLHRAIPFFLSTLLFALLEERLK